VSPAGASRALAIFDAFLHHARASATPASASPAAIAAPAVSTSLRPVAAPPAAPPPPAAREEPDETTRVVAMPVRSPMESTWDDQTEEKPPSPALREAMGDDPATDVSVHLPEVQPHAHAMEQSVIIDDDSLTQPQMEREAAAGDPLPAAAYPAVNELDALLVEMAVLVKYGHAPTAAQELERWTLTWPDDLHGQLRVAEFEMARVDREVALRRYGTLVSLFLDRGDLRSAGDVMRRLRRDMPGDARVAAIAQWNGLDM
jgi:hypothetical protein